jgi:hypothetical protein
MKIITDDSDITKIKFFDTDKRQCQENAKTGTVAQALECPPSKLEAQSSNPEREREREKTSQKNFFLNHIDKDYYPKYAENSYNSAIRK